MSWVLSRDKTSAYREPEGTPMVDDPSIPDRKVADKAANKPFLSYQRYRKQQTREHEAWEKRQAEREKRIANGEDVGPEERDPTAEVDIGIFTILKWVVYAILLTSLAGKFLVGSYTWEYDGKWVQLKTYLPGPSQHLFTETQLAEFDGSRPGRPIYLAIDGEVYDVTNGRAYQPGGSYNHFAGTDAARAFGTGCFQTHRTHDLRGLTEAELKGVNHWKEFYRDHKDYRKVGRVLHKPIDPASPIPEPCKPKKANDQGPKKDTAERTAVKGKAKKGKDKSEL
ncbi:cytochrome b5 [Cylindrobasidium torrendii FP15055 ss-10]|uniref:Cytochrome b5 n=1 Tax=Cylindrobasidium torrendii FP15055 ss-10 TaxID=1314674 RepID=A0A0D7BMI9_9AGAR|nr:cytochrome b5 [Cylindrobasidium torrendii FP15055 ss-10]